MILYPHRLYTAESEATQDENGNWVSGEISEKYICECREETNGKGAQVTIEGGKVFVFASVVYLPTDTPPINAGALVRIKDKENCIRIENTCKKYDVGRLHNRMWL